MTDKPRRRFWQIHLSTAVVVMFVASALIALNLAYYREGEDVFEKDGMLRVEYFDGWGWPLIYEERRSYAFDYQFNRPNVADIARRARAVHSDCRTYSVPWARPINAGIGILILIVGTLVLEFINRRRESRR